MTSGSKRTAGGLSRRYVTALRKQLAPKAGTDSRQAESLGREASAMGLDTLDLIGIHERAVIRLLPAGPASRSSDELLKLAAGFFVKALIPVGNGQRRALKTSDRLNRLNLALRQRTAELNAALRQVKRGIEGREAVQAALTRSERHYNELLEKSGHMQEHLRRLSHELLSSQEEERRKISRELHDEIGQILTAINVKLATLKKEAAINTTGLTRKISSTQRLVERSMGTVHRFARELRPPLLDDLGLIPALHSYLRSFTKRTHIPVHFTAFAEVERLGGDKRTALYRVAQEALTNVEKHAKASLVTLTLRRLAGAIRMEIHDDGRSFRVERVLRDKRTGRLGLIGMRERVDMAGGSFTVVSAPGQGTTIRAQIPFGDGPVKSPNVRGESMK